MEKRLILDQDSRGSSPLAPAKGKTIVYHRIRRGKLVEIPPEWRGKIVYSHTKRQRRSNLTRKLVQRYTPSWYRKNRRPSRMIEKQQSIKEQLE